MKFVGIGLDKNNQIIIVLREPAELKDREEIFRLHKLHQPEIAMWSITIRDWHTAHHEVYDAESGSCMVSVTL